MAIDQKSMLQAVYDAIFDALTTAPHGVGDGKPILPRATTYMSLCTPGIPIDITQYANAWSPVNPQGLPSSTENFSTLVDDTPMMNPLYQSSGGSIDGLYGEIIRANVTAPRPDPAAQAAYDKAFNLLNSDVPDFDSEGRPITSKGPSPIYVNYMNKRASYTAALTSYLANYNQYDLSKPDQARKWSIMAPVLMDPVDMAYQALQSAHPGAIETALDTIGQQEQSSLAGIFTRARETYDQTRQGSILQPGLFFHICDAFPGNWFADSGQANFTAMTIDSQSVRLSSDSRFSSAGGSAGANFGLWRVGGGASHQSQQSDMSSDSSGLKMSFRFGRVEIRRRWLNSSLFSLKGWSTAGRSPGGYSNGQALNNPGIFSLLTTSFIVARDIQISANWGHSDLHTASQSTSASASVGWGPFSVSGSYSNGSSSKRFNSSFDGATLAVPGIQIIAWLSTIVPFCPPTGGPPSQPEATSRGLFAPDKRRNPYAAPYAVSAATFDPSDDFSFMDSGRPTNGRSVHMSEPAAAPVPDDLKSTFVSAEL